MYAVIFKAEVNQFGEIYCSMVKEMRGLAIEKYHCKAFSACTYELNPRLKECKKSLYFIVKARKLFKFGTKY